MRLTIAVLLVALASCAGTPRAAGIDPIFELSLSERPVFLPTEPETPPVEGLSEGQLLLEFILKTGEERLEVPSLVVDAGDRAEIVTQNQFSYVADYDLEVAEDAYTAEPVIKIVETGLKIGVTALLRADGRIDLAYRIEVRDLPLPLRRIQSVMESNTGEAVIIDLPAVTAVTAAGRATLAPGVETRLARLPTWVEGESRRTEVTVRATPLDQAASSSAEVLMVDRGDVAVHLSVLNDLAPGEIRYLTGAAGARFLEKGDIRRLSSFLLRTDPASALEVETTRNVSYLQDFDVEVYGLGAHASDPLIGQVTEGFTARATMSEGGPALAYSFGSLAPMQNFTTTPGGTGPVTIELPNLDRRSGELPLRANVNVVGIAALEDGGTLALIVLLP
jgi:hypothetical protein